MFVCLANVVGYLIEIDDKSGVRLNRYTFTQHDAEHGVHIHEHLHLRFDLSDFVGCKIVDRLVNKQEFKGIYFSSRTHLFYVFINNYYLRGEFDLVNRNLRIQDECTFDKQEKRVYLSGGGALIERRSMKYVKQATVNKTYLTLNPWITYNIDLRDRAQKGEEQIVATNARKLANKCPNQILEVYGISFCFEPSVSLDRISV